MRTLGIITFALFVALALPVCEVRANEGAILGLTEPFRTIDVAAVESGVIAELNVKEGDIVSEGQKLAKLNCEALNALLVISKQSMECKGRLLAAQAELKLQEERAANFAAVFARGHARPEEVRRAETNLAIAKAQLLEAEEEQIRRRLEFERIKTQLELRVVRAPLPGVVSVVHKDRGEYVAPNDPNVLTIVQLDPLLAVFTLTVPQARQLQTDQKVTLKVDEYDEPVTASVEFIAPVADPESGTVLVKMRVPNPNGAIRSGARCNFVPPESKKSGLVQQGSAQPNKKTD